MNPKPKDIFNKLCKKQSGNEPCSDMWKPENKKVPFMAHRGELARRTDAEKVEILRHAIACVLGTSDLHDLQRMCADLTFSHSDESVNKHTLINAMLLTEGDEPALYDDASINQVIDKYKHNAAFNRLANIILMAFDQDLPVTTKDFTDAVLAGSFSHQQRKFLEAINDDKQRGLHRKYVVFRTDGSSLPGGKHENCEYFVLDWDHDPFTIPAMEAYAEACKEKYPELAVDIYRKIRAYRTKHNHEFTTKEPENNE